MPQDAAVRRSDEELASAVHRALVSNLAVPDRTIRLAVVDGVVMLSGTVSSPGEREEAERAAASVPGVLAVRNEIGVWPSDMESELVRETTREILDATLGK